VLSSCGFRANTVIGQCLHHADVQGVEESFPAFQAELSVRIIGSTYLRRSDRSAATTTLPPVNETGGQTLTYFGAPI